MKVALVSDPLTVYGGAERVIEQILLLYPNADVFALIDTLDETKRGFLGGRPVKTSPLQRIPGVKRYYQTMFPLWPIAIEQLDLSDYDLVISSHHSVAWGCLTGPGQVHVSYVHSPMRYGWDQQHEYLREAGLQRGLKSLLARYTLHRARLWDFAAAHRPSLIMANSGFVAERLRRSHGVVARVVYPPVAVDQLSAARPIGKRPQGEGRAPQEQGSYYLSVGRLVPYKRAYLLAQAFAAMPNRELRIVGTGPDEARIRALGAPNVHLLGSLPTDEVRALMAGTEAFLFAGVEDFGIAAVEAQATGSPVIAYKGGGMAETVLAPPNPRPTGAFFQEQSVDAIRAAIAAFEARPRPLAADCIANAARFSEARFHAGFSAAIEEALAGTSRNFSIPAAA